MAVDKEILYEHLLPHLIEPLAENLQGRVWSYCPVPSHGDGTKHGRSGPGLAGRSLSLHPTIGVTCFGGCDFAEIMACFPPLPDGARLASAPRRMVAEYEYREADGTLKAIKQRFEQRGPDGTVSKDFLWFMPGNTFPGLSFPMEEAPLWGAEILSMVPEADWIYFTEGEKAAQACRAHGLTAVCAGTGANPAPRIQHALSALKGRKVALWPDNDDKGRTYMLAVMNLLKPIAGELRVVRANVPHKGDAYDFFYQGGQVSDLESGVIKQRSVEFLTEDCVKLSIPVVDQVFEVTVRDFERTRRSLECWLEFGGVAAGSRPRRINLLSETAVTGLVRSLKDRHGSTVAWAEVIDDMCIMLGNAFSELDVFIDAATIPPSAGVKFLVDKLIVLNEENMLYGRREAGKTYLALALAAAVAHEQDALGDATTRPGAVIWLDYETNRDTFGFRLRRVCDQWGMTPSPDRIFYMRAAAPVAEMVEVLKAKIESAGIVLMVIDSMGRAAGGDLRDQQTVQTFFAALRRLNVTSITLAHTKKDDDPDAPFGSVYVVNEPHGMVWYGFKSSSSSLDEIIMGLVNKKSSDFSRPEPHAVSMQFTGNAGAVYVSHTALSRVPDFASRKDSLQERIAQLLRTVNGGPKSAQDLADELQVTPDQVKYTCRNHPAIFSDISSRRNWDLILLHPRL